MMKLKLSGIYLPYCTMNNLPENIVIIGAGRVAYSIAGALKKENYTDIRILSTSLESARILAEKFSLNNYFNDYSAISLREAVYLITVPDEQITVAAERLAENAETDFSGSLFIHFSGALSLDALQPLKDKGANLASLHIMQSFHSRKAVPLDNLFCAVETEDDIIKELVFKFAKSLGLNPKAIDSKDKVLYHLAGVFASNFLFSDLYFAKQLLEKVFPNAANSMDIIGNLVSTSVYNAVNYDIPDSVTGPVIRGDLNTVKKHIEAISKPGCSILLLKAYIVNSLNIINMVELHMGGLTKEQEAIKAFLQQFKYI